MTRRRWFIGTGVVLVLAAGASMLVWTTCRVYVPYNRCAVLIRKMGKLLPEGQRVATEPGYRGIQVEVLGPGRHFYNPIVWDWELKPLTVVPSGDPSTWEWIHSLNDEQRDQLRAGTFEFKGEFPQIGVVTRLVGPVPPAGQIIVDRKSGMQGILREVLTPGTYKLNPYVYKVQLHPAVVIPAGFVGVVTNLFGNADTGGVSQPVATTKVPDSGSTDASVADAEPSEEMARDVPPLALVGQRGTLRDVLQPGVYFINPKLQKVTLIEIGFNEYSQVKVSEAENYRIPFPSDTGYDIKVGVTVVWGIDPQHAAEIINEFGNIDRVLDKVIGPQLRSIARNVGSTYAARDFIQGEKREKFQRAMTAELQRVCRAKNIEVLLALVREIEVHAPGARNADADVTESLKRTIQESYVAIEKQLTNAKQRDAAAVRATLEEEQKKIDIKRETIQAETRVLVANIGADAEKEAATIDAQAQLEIAAIRQEVATLAAKRVEILGRANADVTRLKNEAEAEGYEMLVNAFGGGEAYNLYTFAENFQPESIRLFFAGDGTFWTDLSRFEELGAAKLLKPKAGTD